MVSVPRTAFGHSIDKHGLTLSLSPSLSLSFLRLTVQTKILLPVFVFINYTA